MTFNPHDQKHKQACEDLEFLTGAPFKLTQVNTSVGELWVYRTQTAALPPNADLLGSEEYSPLNINPSNYLAKENANLMHLNMSMNAPYARVTSVDSCARTDIAELPSRDFQGYVDLVAESKNGRNAINLDTLRNEVAYIKRDKNREREYLDNRQSIEGFITPIADEDRAKIPKLFELWQERMNNLQKSVDAMGSQSHIILDPNKRLARDALDNGGITPDRSLPNNKDFGGFSRN